MTQPVTTRTLPPSFRVRVPTNRPVANMVTPEGSSIRPERVMLAPNPYPAEDGVCTNSGRNANIAYRPMPISSATRLFVQTPGRRIIFMSISGVTARSSDQTQAAASSTAAASSPMTAGDPQPQSGASLSGTSSATSQPDSSTAGSQLIVPGLRIGDWGTNSIAPIAATAVAMPGSQNSQCQLSAFTIGPASTMPRLPPTAVSAARMPTAPATFSRGNSSRMIPNPSGSVPPPSPWIARATIITPRLGATAASTDPTARPASAATKTHFLPIMSPSRPRIGVMTEADSRYAVSTHVTALCEVCSSTCTVLSTGITSDCSSANAPMPIASTPNVT